MVTGDEMIIDELADESSISDKEMASRHVLAI